MGERGVRMGLVGVIGCKGVRGVRMECMIFSCFGLMCIIIHDYLLFFELNRNLFLFHVQAFLFPLQ